MYIKSFNTIRDYADDVSTVTLEDLFSIVCQNLDEDLKEAFPCVHDMYRNKWFTAYWETTMVWHEVPKEWFPEISALVFTDCPEDIYDGVDGNVETSFIGRNGEATYRRREYLFSWFDIKCFLAKMSRSERQTKKLVLYNSDYGGFLPCQGVGNFINDNPLVTNNVSVVPFFSIKKIIK